MDLVASFVVVSALVTALRWIRQTWFFSVGYAFSVVAMVAATAVAAREQLRALAGIQLVLLAVWGLRLHAQPSTSGVVNMGATAAGQFASVVAGGCCWR